MSYAARRAAPTTTALLPAAAAPRAGGSAPRAPTVSRPASPHQRGGALGYLHGAGVVYALQDAVTLLGRDASCDIVLAGARSVSSRHARIELAPDAAAAAGSAPAAVAAPRLVDTSLNGSWLNGCRVRNAPARLRSGDALRFGHAPEEFCFFLPADLPPRPGLGRRDATAAAAEAADELPAVARADGTARSEAGDGTDASDEGSVEEGEVLEDVPPLPPVAATAARRLPPPLPPAQRGGYASRMAGASHVAAAGVGSTRQRQHWQELAGSGVAAALAMTSPASSADAAAAQTRRLDATARSYALAGAARRAGLSTHALAASPSHRLDSSGSWAGSIDSRSPSPVAAPLARERRAATLHASAPAAAPASLLLRKPQLAAADETATDGDQAHRRGAATLRQQQQLQPQEQSAILSGGSAPLPSRRPQRSPAEAGLLEAARRAPRPREGVAVAAAAALQKRRQAREAAAAGPPRPWRMHVQPPAPALPAASPLSDAVAPSSPWLDFAEFEERGDAARRVPHGMSSQSLPAAAVAARPTLGARGRPLAAALPHAAAREAHEHCRTELAASSTHSASPLASAPPPASSAATQRLPRPPTPPTSHSLPFPQPSLAPPLTRRRDELPLEEQQLQRSSRAPSAPLVPAPAGGAPAAAGAPAVCAADVAWEEACEAAAPSTCTADAARGGVWEPGGAAADATAAPSSPPAALAQAHDAAAVAPRASTAAGGTGQQQLLAAPPAGGDLARLVTAQRSGADGLSAVAAPAPDEGATAGAADHVPLQHTASSRRDREEPLALHLTEPSSRRPEATTAVAPPAAPPVVSSSRSSGSVSSIACATRQMPPSADRPAADVGLSDRTPSSRAASDSARRSPAQPEVTLQGQQAQGSTAPTLLMQPSSPCLPHAAAAPLQQSLPAPLAPAPPPQPPPQALPLPSLPSPPTLLVPPPPLPSSRPAAAQQPVAPRSPLSSSPPLPTTREAPEARAVWLLRAALAEVPGELPEAALLRLSERRSGDAAAAASTRLLLLQQAVAAAAAEHDADDSRRAETAAAAQRFRLAALL